MDCIHQTSQAAWLVSALNLLKLDQAHIICASLSSLKSHEV